MTLADHTYVGSGVLGNIRGLRSRRGDTAAESPNNDTARRVALEVKVKPSWTTAEDESVGVRSISRIRAWMVVPPWTSS